MSIFQLIVGSLVFFGSIYLIVQYGFNRGSLAGDGKRYRLRKGKHLQDGDIIGYAAHSGGRISAAALSMKARISVDEATQWLNQLQEQGVFEIKVNEFGTVLYFLTDTDLLSDQKEAED